MNLLTKQKETHRLRKQTHGCHGEGIVKDFGKVMYTLLYLKQITMELCSMLCASLDRGGLGGEWIYVYIWLSSFTVHLKLSQYC